MHTAVPEFVPLEARSRVSVALSNVTCVARRSIVAEDFSCNINAQQQRKAILSDAIFPIFEKQSSTHREN